MKLDLSNIFNEQKQLDLTIQKNHNVNYETVSKKLIVALAVELGELANEVRCFKFWSFKPASSKDKIIEEYADGIHFITSISIMHSISPIFEVCHEVRKLDNEQLSCMFKELFDLISTLNNPNDIRTWYVKYIELGFALGFDINDIIDAYQAKHQKNIDRQNSNY